MTELRDVQPLWKGAGKMAGGCIGSSTILAQHLAFLERCLMEASHTAPPNDIITGLLHVRMLLVGGS